MRESAMLTLSSPNHQTAGRPANSWKIMYKYDRRAKLELQNKQQQFKLQSSLYINQAEAKLK